jgi:hypothetical protein
VPKAYYVITIFQTFAPIIPLLIYWKTRRHQESHMRFLVALLVLSLFSDVVGMIGALWIKSTLLIYSARNIYLVGTIVSITLFYKALFPQKLSKFFWTTMLVLLLGHAYFLFARETLTTGDRNVPQNVVYTIFSLLFFYKLMRELPTVHIQRLPIFWINAGVLIYYSGTLLLWIFTDYLIRVFNQDYVYFMIFHNFLTIIKYLFFAIGLWQATPRTKSL